MVEVKNTRDLQRCKALFALETYALFPQSAMLYSVFEARNPGIVLTDNTVEPSWCAVRPDWGANVFIAGKLNTLTIAKALTYLRQSDWACIALTDSSDYNTILPADYYDDQARLYFDNRSKDDRRIYDLIDSKPVDIKAVQINSGIINRLSQYSLNDIITSCGSIEKFFTNAVGYCLMLNNEIISEAYGLFWGEGKVDIGVKTHPDYREEGYASIVCAYLIDSIEKQGLTTQWACNRANIASTKLARKFGYTTEIKYKLRRYEVF